jgi:predicted protein tyrosine phosphatase
MLFIVMNRRIASKITFNYSGDSDFAIISITDVNSEENVFDENNNHLVGICRVKFDDVDFGDKNCITSDDAKKILSFVDSKVGKVSFIIVQCEAGISRSAGVCAGLMKIYNGDDFEIFDNPKYCPNMSCYRTILETYFGSYNEEEANNKFLHNVEIAREYEDW